MWYSLNSYSIQLTIFAVMQVLSYFEFAENILITIVIYLSFEVCQDYHVNGTVQIAIEDMFNQDGLLD